ncbi:MAG: hypothetical protein U5K79_19150 [Cyclobacteriaceae bacterium]|nr:hypothetical protein [Cyclobacteriaceae bacterium]
MKSKNYSPGQNNVKYPLIVFFHGAGEAGLDNDKQLVHGGQTHRDAVKSGTFPGFLLYPQIDNSSSNWSVTDRNRVKSIIDVLIEKYDVDPTRIYIHGLSMGGGGAWRFLDQFTTLIATAYPMADAGPEAITLSTNSKIKYTPLWYSQGQGRYNLCKTCGCQENCKQYKGGWPRWRNPISLFSRPRPWGVECYLCPNGFFYEYAFQKQTLHSC